MPLPIQLNRTNEWVGWVLDSLRECRIPSPGALTKEVMLTEVIKSDSE